MLTPMYNETDVPIFIAMCENRQARLAILGAGAVTRIFYLPILRAPFDDLKLCSIVDTSPATLELLKPIPCDVRTFQGTFDAYFSQLNSSDLDAVIVALPHHLHESAVIGALGNGLHVFCEKPLGLTVDSVERMNQASESYGKKLCVCQPRRSFPAAQTIKELLATGWLGAVKNVQWSEGQPYAWPAESLSQLLREFGGGELYDIGAHVFDLLGWWFGDLEVSEYEDDARGGTAAEYRVGLIASDGLKLEVNLSRLHKLSNTATITCERGTIFWNLRELSSIKVELPLEGARRRFSIGTDDASAFTMKDAIKRQLIEFSALIQGKDSKSTSGECALRYARVFDECRASQCVEEPPRLDSSKGRSVVIGASGFIGSRLVEKLFDQGVPVTPVARRPQSCVSLARLPVQIALADVTKPESLDSILRGGGDVLYLCTVASGIKQIVWDTVVTGTLNTLRVAEKHGFRRVVVFSSMLAYGDPPPSGCVDEKSAFRSTDLEYARAKHALEGLCARFSANSQLQIVMLEPTCVFGPFGKDFGSAHLDAVLAESFVLFNEGKGNANLVYVDNLADAAVCASTMNYMGCEKFIINEEEHQVTWRDYFSSLVHAALEYEIGVFPSLSPVDISQVEKYRRAQRTFPQVIRNSVRNHIPAQEWLESSNLFKLLKKRHGSKKVLETSSILTEQTAPGSNVYADKETILSSFRNAQRFYLSSSVANFFSSNATYSSRKFRDRTGWSPAISFPIAMEATCEWAKQAYASQRQE